MKKSVILAVVFLVILAVSAFSQEAQNPIQPGDFIFNFGLTNDTLFSDSARFDAGEEDDLTLLGFRLAADYALPIPLTIGIEGGMLFLIGDIDLGLVMARIAWHPWFGVKELDTYLMGKAGVGILEGKGKYNTVAGISFGADIGARYFFTEHFGAFTELGFEGFGFFFPDERIPLAGFDVSLGVTVKF